MSSYDLRMDDIDRVNVLKQIRIKDQLTPIYIITAFQKELKHLKNEGLSFELLNKPIDSSEINAVTKGVLG